MGEIDGSQTAMLLEEVRRDKVAAGCPRVDEEGGLHTVDTVDGDLDCEELIDGGGTVER